MSLKILNPQNRWGKIITFRESKKIKRLKERELIKYIDSLTSSYGWNLQEIEEHKQRMLTLLKEGNYNTHECSPVCFRKKYKKDSWRAEVWRNACHWASHIYLEYAKEAYPEYHWYRVEGSDHSTVLGFKEKQHAGKKWLFEYLKADIIVPDVAYDLLAWYLKLNPFMWAVHGKEVEIRD